MERQAVGGGARYLIIFAPSHNTVWAILCCTSTRCTLWLLVFHTAACPAPLRPSEGS